MSERGGRVVAIVEARMASTRLPGKVLMPAAGKPMLAHLVARLRAAPSIDQIVIATTTSPGDEVIERFAADAGVGCFRGSPEDVMQRVIDAGVAFGAELVVEVTGDCPITDPELVEQMVRMHRAHPRADYTSNCGVRSYPDGMEVQVFPLVALQRSAAMTDAALDHEHVTLHMRNHPELFPAVHLVAPPSQHWPGLGLTLDEPGDYQLLRTLIEHFPGDPLFGCADAIRALREHPQWLGFNDTVVRKGDN
jgi:spore coat polysaccharide biosynthesis protein SpsF